MPSNSITILDETTHPNDSTVETVTGDKYKGDGYYGRSDGLHTVQINLNDFVGTINIQATLSADPTSSDWFTVELGTGSQSVDTTGLIAEENITEIEYTDATTNNKVYNFTGNYVWVRAYVSYTAGTINSIMLNH
jgi:hypothetical protein